MGFDISAKTLSQTTQCPDNFKCLEDGRQQVCAAERYIEGNGLFIRERRREYCPYLIPFGYGYICNCPTHVELYQRYQI